MQNETLTLAEAKSAHPGAHIQVIDRSNSEGEVAPAIYVWAAEADSENDDGAKCVALYWLGHSFDVTDGTDTWTEQAADLDALEAILRGRSAPDAGYDDPDFGPADVNYEILDGNGECLRAVTVSI